jgi:hypothetical protein
MVSGKIMLTSIYILKMVLRKLFKTDGQKLIKKWWKSMAKNDKNRPLINY